ncbi:hypothetical protein [Streptomyces ureilyticus]|uniref:Uncharacterized protein n=1 Tax=Streptomyces ureilyticus TaxID=1775131 RepID=A0ABX0E696_9ACTN|nr:hypothetical protein [Streptomyces ureilyticus]NGO48455.1 hypothetical protein [Streptomyces ureilyticus]
MEQRRGPSIQPLQGAAADPAFVPGITGPRPADPKGLKDPDPADETAAAEETASEETDTAADQADDVSDEGASAESDDADQPDEAEDREGTAEPESEPEGEAESESDESDDSDHSEATRPDGPVFEAADYRAKITADHSGVRLRLDDHEAEFRWDEIGAVESETSRFGRWYTITVHTPERRWYPVELRVPSRAKVKEWEKELDEVLDAYFQE